jgi:hypothetical protein
MPRPITRRPVGDPELDEPEGALRDPLERDDPDALRAFPVLLLLLRLFELLLDPLLALREPLLELPFPPLAPIPPLLRFGMSISW